MLVAALASLITIDKDECLMFVSRNLAKGDSNWFTYYTISDAKVTFKKGDKFTYDIFLDPQNPVAKGAIDIDVDSGDPLRDSNVNDTSGHRAHGDTVLDEAKGHWLHREIPLDKLSGRTSVTWNLNFEGDPYGRYMMVVDNVKVTHPDGTVDVIYEGGRPKVAKLDTAAGYSKFPAWRIVDRADIQPGKDLEPIIAATMEQASKKQALEAIDQELGIVEKYLKDKPMDIHTRQHLDQTRQYLDALYASDNVTPQQIEAALHMASQAMEHAHPEMQKYTGHLVGHAHIDLQWLWEWQEGIVASHDTFNQAVKFMDEFPGFTFSQSSSVIYKAVQDAYPDLFKKVQAKVKKGQWEIVGGRVCEGDTNMISPESHAMQFLYGQTYFKENFGKTAVVGWEPDTFGHTIQMPQILKMGGCKYYYFCRGGKGKPLFWWQALDGTKVLAFDEPASGSWYNSDISYKQFQEMLDFENNTGSKDALMVYGVGNHGGGPSREMIQEAMKMMSNKDLPPIKFSTATQFFKKLETYDLKKIPVINEELNPVFDGCYTTHSEVKQLNREAENTTATAEAVAVMANQFGFAYPHAQFRKSWEDICFNHHHDTLPGSGIHAPYENTKVTLGRAIADSNETITKAMELLSLRVTPKTGGMSFVVANPLGWKRSGWVETLAVPSGWNGQNMDLDQLVAYGPDGTSYPVEVLDRITHRIRFYAGDVPSFGYKVFQVKNGGVTVARGPVKQIGWQITGPDLSAEIDAQYGGFKTLTFRGKTFHNVGRLRLDYERPGGMTAWVIQGIAKSKPWVASNVEIHQRPYGVDVIATYSMDSVNRPGTPTKVMQKFELRDGATEIPVTVDCDWHNVGSSSTDNPMLRVAFDVEGDSPKAEYDVPFGYLERPADGKEYPALKWGALGDLAILNDCKYGYDATGNTLTMTLIRSSYEPDPEPNPGHHTWHYSIRPKGDDETWADVTRAGYDLNQPLLCATVPFDAKGAAPLEWSALSMDDPSAISYGLKLAEGSNDPIARLYSCGPDATKLGVQTVFSGKKVNEVNFLEDRLNAFNPVLRGFEIKSIRWSK
ncbi:MAG: alpha-mannosidase [Armatimonadetes bacterium]|nr:alpha-mannosidase [Armatimonadota bacterium]